MDKKLYTFIDPETFDCVFIATVHNKDGYLQRDEIMTGKDVQMILFGFESVIDRIKHYPELLHYQIVSLKESLEDGKIIIDYTTNLKWLETALKKECYYD